MSKIEGRSKLVYIVAISALLLLLGVVVFLLPSVRAACPTTINVTITSHPYLLIDANKPGEEGPLVTTVYAEITNTGTNSTESVYVYVGDGITPGSFPVGSDGDNLAMLGNTSDATRFMVNLAPGESKTVYWMLTYPMTFAQTYPLTVWADNEAGCSAQDSHIFNTRSAI